MSIDQIIVELREHERSTLRFVDQNRISEAIKLLRNIPTSGTASYNYSSNSESCPECSSGHPCYGHNHM